MGRQNILLLSCCRHVTGQPQGQYWTTLVVMFGVYPVLKGRGLWGMRTIYVSSLSAHALWSREGHALYSI